MNISIPKISIDSNDEQDSTDIIASQQGFEGLLNCSTAKGSVTSLYSSDMLAPTENDVALLPRSPVMRRGRISSEKEIEDVANPKQQKISKIELMKKLFSFEPKAKKTDDSIGLTPDDSDSRNASKTSLNGSRRSSQTSLLASKKNASGSRSNTSLFRNMAKRLSFVNVNDPVSKLEKIDGYIMKLRECTQSHGFPLSCDEVKELCRDAKELVSSQPILLELTPPINICGDIHGQYKDLLEIFNICGEPGISNYLFLGDYVDRGQMSLETITLMMCYKLKYPDTFFMLRGNHECSNINRVYGFFDECKRKLNTKIWKCFTEFFEYLPLAAVIGDRVFCVHGGISPFLQSLDDIKKIERPLYIERTGLQADLLWSDPSDTTDCWQENEDRGVSYVFGAPQVNNFLKKFDFDLIVRAHMVVEDGYQFFNDKSLVTIFSAPNYCGNFDNLGGILCIDQNLTVTFKFITAKTYEIMD